MKFPEDLTSLCKAWEEGQRFQLLFFYGHKPPVSGFDASCLSQWFESPFVIDGSLYPTTEHWMMAEKARLFNDSEILEAILFCDSPRDVQAFGRKVNRFDQKIWNEKRIEIVRQGNIAKFEQNNLIRQFLLSTSGTILVEASERDDIWGIGLGSRNSAIHDPRTWRGQNLLGFVLTEVRELLGNLH